MSVRDRMFQLIERQASLDLSRAEDVLERAELGRAALVEVARRPGTLDPAVLNMADHITERLNTEVSRLRDERDKRAEVRKAASTDRRRFESLAERNRDRALTAEARREQRAYDDLSGARRGDK